VTRPARPRGGGIFMPVCCCGKTMRPKTLRS
jgi:hypothetical protein